MREALGYSRDWGDEGDTDLDGGLVSDAKIAKYLANQARLYGESLFGDLYAAGVWGEDWAGAAAKDYASDEVLYWDNASANPREDIMYLSSLIEEKSGGAEPNTLVVGNAVHRALASGDLLGDKVDQSALGTMGNMQKFVRDYFGIPNYHVGNAIINSALEGDTDVMGRIIDTNSVWLGYVDASASSADNEVYTAMRTLAFDNNGRNKNGMNIRKYIEENRTSITSDMDLWQSVEITAPDAGAFIDSVLTPP